MKQPDELTSAIIRITCLETKTDMLLEKCNKSVWKAEEALEEARHQLIQRDKEIEALRKKLYTLAGAVKKLAVSQGRLPEKAKETKHDIRKKQQLD